ncbi:hypothetical protein NMY22_g12903 [Coprinellus aureogranulatus]|nr:hypothetical protein NMY22_g12903 [Coprinellus aureogranulatus]
MPSGEEKLANIAGDLNILRAAMDQLTVLYSELTVPADSQLHNEYHEVSQTLQDLEAKHRRLTRSLHSKDAMEMISRFVNSSSKIRTLEQAVQDLRFRMMRVSNSVRVSREAPVQQSIIRLRRANKDLREALHRGNINASAPTLTSPDRFRGFEGYAEEVEQVPHSLPAPPRKRDKPRSHARGPSLSTSAINLGETPLRNGEPSSYHSTLYASPQGAQPFVHPQQDIPPPSAVQSGSSSRTRSHLRNLSAFNSAQPGFLQQQPHAGVVTNFAIYLSL